jgi:hypothetical protein
MKNRFGQTAVIVRYQMMLALIVSACGIDAFADQPKLGDVLKAWESRQESFKSVRVAWTEERTDRKGSMRGAAPPEDSTLRSKCTLLVSGDRTCYSFFGKVWARWPDRAEVVTRKYKSTFDGETFTSLRAPIGAEQGPQVVTDRRPNRDVKSLEMRSLAWYFWPLRPTCGGLARDDLALSERTEELEGEVLAVLEERSTSRPGRGNWWEFWIEPSEGFLIRRARAHNPVGVYCQFDIDYKADADGVRHPCGWKMLDFDDGKMVRSRVCDMSEIVVNPPVTDADFKIESPKGETSEDAE